MLHLVLIVFLVVESNIRVAIDKTITSQDKL